MENKKILFEEFKQINFFLADSYKEQEKQILNRAFDFLTNFNKTEDKDKLRSLKVARICAEEFLLGPVSITSSILYTIITESEIILDDIKQTFCEEVENVLLGLIEMDKIVINVISDVHKSLNNLHAFDDILSKDIRIIVLKIADKLNKVREIETLNLKEKKEISKEVLSVYAPLAKRLGFYDVQSELGDIGLKYFDPESYNYLTVKLTDIKQEKGEYINSFILPIEKALLRSGFEFEIFRREKSIYSIWDEMRLNNVSFEEIYSIFTVRVVVETDKDFEKEHCWKVYSIITDEYFPAPERLRDWLSNPKSNGYEALHATVMGPQGRWIEVQICTTRMNEFETQGLNLKGLQLKDISLLNDFRRLNQLDLSHNEINDISPLKNLKNLTKLNLSYNNISEIDPLENLTGLRILNLRNNNIRALPKWVIQFNVEIKWENEEYTLGINFFNNPLEGEYIDLVKQGRDFIKRFFERVKIEGIGSIFEGKLILVGEGNAGKTSLQVRLIDETGALPQKDARTRGIKIHDWSFGNDLKGNYIAHIWDFGGQDVYYPVHRFFITDNSVFVLLASTRQTNHNFDYWIPTIYQFGGKSPIILGQTCNDGNKVPWNDLDRYFGDLHFNLIKTQTLPYYEINLPKSNEGLKKIKETIISQLKNLPHFGKGVPKSWVTIRNIIAEKSRNIACLSVDSFFEICKNSNPNFKSIDDVDDCAKFLHSIGVVLWYHEFPELKNWIVLQPEWAMNAVYKIIDDDEIQSPNRSGNIYAKDFTRLWNDVAYEGKDFILKKMLEVFKIAFPKKHRKEDYIIPARLLSMPREAKWKDDDPYTRIEFQFKFMPKGIVNQISAELSRYIITDKEVWNNAVNLEYNTSQSQIEEDFNDKKVTIKAKGKEARDLITLVMDAMKNIAETYKGVEPELIVPCTCKKCKDNSKPTYFPYNKLLEWQDSQGIVYCNESLEKIPIENLLFNVGLLNPKTEKRKVIKLFLASSSELQEDRKEFEIFISRENKRLHGQRIFIELIMWEDFSDAMSQSSLQDEYGKAVLSSDIFISLFFTKVGKYTYEEFESAFGQFMVTGKPLVYTYFKDAEIKMGELTEEINTLLNFKEKLKILGHFPTIYKNTDDLKNKFRMQLDKILL